MKTCSTVLEFFSRGQTDGHGEASRRIFTTFCREHAYCPTGVELHRPGYGNEEKIITLLSGAEMATLHPDLLSLLAVLSYLE